MERTLLQYKITEEVDSFRFITEAMRRNDPATYQAIKLHLGAILANLSILELTLKGME